MWESGDITYWNWSNKSSVYFNWNKTMRVYKGKLVKYIKQQKINMNKDMFISDNPYMLAHVGLERPTCQEET